MWSGSGRAMNPTSRSSTTPANRAARTSASTAGMSGAGSTAWQTAAAPGPGPGNRPRIADHGRRRLAAGRPWGPDVCPANSRSSTWRSRRCDRASLRRGHFRPHVAGPGDVRSAGRQVGSRLPRSAGHRRWRRQRPMAADDRRLRADLHVHADRRARCRRPAAAARDHLPRVSQCRRLAPSPAGQPRVVGGRGPGRQSGPGGARRFRGARGQLVLALVGDEGRPEDASTSPSLWKLGFPDFAKKLVAEHVYEGRAQRFAIALDGPQVHVVGDRWFTAPALGEPFRPLPGQLPEPGFAQQPALIRSNHYGWLLQLKHSRRVYQVEFPESQ